MQESLQGFGKQLRLLKTAEFDRVFKTGQRIQSDCFSAIVASNGLPHARIGFAIGKKHAPLAVTRNRLRRHFREHFRHMQPALDGVDIVLSLRRAPPDDARALLHRFCQTMGQRCARR